MASLASFLLLAAFVVCSYAAVVSVAGARRGSRRLIESGIGAFYLVCALMTAASAVIINAFLTGDYSIKYVAHYSDSVQPLFYRIASYWGGLDSSIMFWVFLLSVFGSAAVYVNREQHREPFPTSSPPYPASRCLFATMFPTLSEAITGHRLTIATVFYNRWMAPVGVILLLLTGVGPLLAWRKSTLTNLRQQFQWPATSAIVTGSVLAMLGLRVWPSGLCFALCGFVTGTIVQEFWRGGLVRRRHTGTDILTAIIGLVGRNRRRYGGYIVHLGIVLMFAGFAGNAYRQDTQVELRLGDQTTLGRYTLRNDAVKIDDDGQKQMATAHISVFDRGSRSTSCIRARWVLPEAREGANDRGRHPPIGHRGSLRRVCVRPREPRVAVGDAADVINPLVNWIWLGFGVLALGTGIALLPEGGYSFALTKLGTKAATSAATGAPTTAGTAVTTAALTLALAVLVGTECSRSTLAAAQRAGLILRAQPAGEAAPARIVCTCGSCGHAGIGECRKDPCVVSDRMRRELAAWIDQGRSHDQIIHAFVETYGSEEMLGAPIDRGSTAWRGCSRTSPALPGPSASASWPSDGRINIRRHSGDEAR